MKSTHLRTFLAVATVGSFSAAARRVHVSQSTASLHVKELEADVGVQLLDRTRDGVVPTAAGRVMMRYAHQLLGLEREAVTDVRAHADLAVDALHVAASTVLGDVHLPPVLAAFANAWPNVQVAMRVTGSAAALTALRLGDVEVAFLGQRPTGDGRRATTLWCGRLPTTRWSWSPRRRCRPRMRQTCVGSPESSGRPAGRPWPP